MIMIHVKGYLDLQVNGYDGINFNADGLDAQDVARVCSRLRTDGVSGILATIITDNVETMCQRLANVCEVRRENPVIADMICGFHIEGPFLNEQQATSELTRPSSQFRRLLIR